jgi:hypothetical protein
MPSKSHDEEAKVRDEEVSKLHPNSERRHIRATLPARVVIRSVEREADERELKILGESYLTAVVADDHIEFYAGSSPVWHAASIDTSRIVEVDTSHELESAPPGVWPMLRLKMSEDGMERPLDIDLEVFTFDGDELVRTEDIRPDVAWWRAAIAV